MKRIAALCGALLLTLVMAAPAMANQKVWIADESGPFVFPPAEFGPERIAEDNEFWRSPEYFGEDWACSEDIYYEIRGRSDLWFWYKNNVDTTDPAEYMPEAAAWPWIKGKVKNAGVDSFFENADKTGKVASGKFRNSTRLSHHHLGSPGDTDPETWKEQSTGKFWGINLPGKGTVFHESGNWQGMVAVFLPAKEDIYGYNFHFHGNMVFDYDELCDYFGAGPALTDLPPWVPAP